MTTYTDRIVARARERIPQVLRGTEAHTLIDIYIDAIESLAQGAERMLHMHLRLAQGAELDRWGRLVGAERRGRDDQAYRMRIAVNIALRRCLGTYAHVADVFAALQLDTQIYEYTRTALISLSQESASLNPRELNSIAHAAVPPTVHPVVIVQPPGPVFAFAGHPNSQGFGLDTWSKSIATEQAKRP